MTSSLLGPRARHLLAALGAGSVLLAGCSAPGVTPAPAGSGTAATASGASAPVLDPAAQATALQQLQNRPGKDLKAVRLADGLIPPTNRWFSGLVFGDKPNPVFPLPLSFGLEGSGFGFGLPDVKTTPKTIMGGYRPSVQVKVPGASGWQVSAYDELSVRLTAQGASGVVTIAQGSPYVTFASEKGATLTTNAAFQPSGTFWTATDASGSYGLVADKATVSGTTVTIQPGGHVTWFAVPTGGSAEKLAGLAAPLTSTAASYATGGQVTTTLHYGTAGGATAFGALPHQQTGLTGTTCDLGTYATVLGTMKLCSGNDLRFTTPDYPATATLDVTKLTDAEKTELKTQLTADVATLKPPAADTYFGGKGLYRDAQLYSLAKQLNAPEATQLKTRLTTSFERWTAPTGCAASAEYCFYYDQTNKGIVGSVASFGADEFNDHHFHYGYFLYAAGVLAADDPALVSKYAPVLNLLAADIASSVKNDRFPVRRTFDSYAGHAWASGTSPFADGNNQESSSEAVLAWAGLRLWAQASKNDALGAEAAWMQSLEATAARDYYVAFDRSQPVYQGFAHTITPLIFGGKRDYATWFSPEPAAMLGIQVLPMSPSQGYLKTDAARIGDNLKEALGTKGFTQQYGDYLLMYSALQGETQRADALAKARQFPAASIDDGLTKTYLLASLMTQKG